MRAIGSPVGSCEHQGGVAADVLGAGVCAGKQGADALCESAACGEHKGDVDVFLRGLGRQIFGQKLGNAFGAVMQHGAGKRGASEPGVRDGRVAAAQERLAEGERVAVENGFEKSKLFVFVGLPFGGRFVLVVHDFFLLLWGSMRVVRKMRGFL